MLQLRICGRVTPVLCSDCHQLLQAFVVTVHYYAEMDEMRCQDTSAGSGHFGQLRRLERSHREHLNFGHALC
jgi:hypothetical protein